MIVGGEGLVTCSVGDKYAGPVLGDRSVEVFLPQRPQRKIEVTERFFWDT